MQNIYPQDNYGYNQPSGYQDGGLRFVHSPVQPNLLNQSPQFLQHSQFDHGMGMTQPPTMQTLLSSQEMQHRAFQLGRQSGIASQAPLHQDLFLRLSARIDDRLASAVSHLEGRFDSVKTVVELKI